MRAGSRSLRGGVAENTKWVTAFWLVSCRYGKRNILARPYYYRSRRNLDSIRSAGAACLLAITLWRGENGSLGLLVVENVRQHIGSADNAEHLSLSRYYRHPPEVVDQHKVNDGL